jgi:hypothetical protein
VPQNGLPSQMTAGFFMTHTLSAVIPGRALARTRNLEIPGSMLCIAPGMTV